MSEVLGHDIEGRPLRAGDRAVIVGSSRAASWIIGRNVVVLGKCNVYPNHVDIDVPAAMLDPLTRYPWCSVHVEHLRRIDDRPETVTWESMRDIWQPSEVTA